MAEFNSGTYNPESIGVSSTLSWCNICQQYVNGSHIHNDPVYVGVANTNNYHSNLLILDYLHNISERLAALEEKLEKLTDK